MKLLPDLVPIPFHLKVGQQAEARPNFRLWHLIPTASHLKSGFWEASVIFVFGGKEADRLLIHLKEIIPTNRAEELKERDRSAFVFCPIIVCCAVIVFRQRELSALIFECKWIKVELWHDYVRMNRIELFSGLREARGENSVKAKAKGIAIFMDSTMLCSIERYDMWCGKRYGSSRTKDNTTPQKCVMGCSMLGVVAY